MVPADLLTPYGFQDTVKSSNVELSELVHLGWILEVGRSMIHTCDSEDWGLDQLSAYAVGGEESAARGRAEVVITA